MAQSASTSDLQPLAFQLANERLRERTTAALLTSLNTDPKSVSHVLGGELWLCLTDRACALIQEHQDSQLTAESIDTIRRDLVRGCHLTLERDLRDGGVVLKINCTDWFLIVKPDYRVWSVLAIYPQTLEFHASLTGLSWRLIRSDKEAKNVKPLPLWLLAQAELRGRELRHDARDLRNPVPPADESAKAIRLRQMRDTLPDAVQDLGTAFSLLEWERQHRDRLAWTVTLTPLGKETATHGHGSYLIEQGNADDWPQRSLSFALGLEPRAIRVIVAPDPDSPSRWLLHGPAALPRELTIYELPRYEYARQARIAARLATSRKIRPEDAAIAATQISLRTIAGITPELCPLPGEASWEPRQEQALLLALSDYPVCAIKGPPGTGKSTVIVGLIRRAIRAGQRVLLVAPTHVALDEVLGRVHDLREKGLERTIVPARVAPADERRAQIKPELDQYIARNLGANLARKAQHSLRVQQAALRPNDHFDKALLRHDTTLLRLRALAATRHAHAQAQHQLAAARAALQTATEITAVRHIELSEADNALDIVRQYDLRLADATQHFAELEARFSATQHTLATTEQRRAKREAALERSRHSLEHAQQRFEEAETTLRRAQALVEKRRPTGKLSHLIERVFSPHARAVKATRIAETELTASQRACGKVRRSAATAETNLKEIEWELVQARQAATVVKRELARRLLPAEAALAAALGDDYSNWLSCMPNSLRRAVARTSEIRISVTQVKADAEARVAQAEEVVRTADAALKSAEIAARSEDSKLSALQTHLREPGVFADVDIARQMEEIERQRAETARDMERTTRRRQLLQRWQKLYEHEDGDDQLTAWALTSVNLVAATTQGIATSREFSDNYFDLMICDESSRVTRGEILVPADRAARIVLVGDEKQLPPYVEAYDEQLIQALATIQLSGARTEDLPAMASRLCDAWNIDELEFRPVRVQEVSELARTLIEKGDLPIWPVSTTEAIATDERLRAWRDIADSLTGSCFDHLLRILSAERIVRLNVQRRMVAEIAVLVSEPVYDGDYQSPETLPVTPLLTDAFRHAWVFVNTRRYCAVRPDFREEHQGTGFVNEGEARAVVVALRQHVSAARRTGTPISLMVITFYLAQARLVESFVRQDPELRRERIAILPIDRCQGQEADVVVVSFVRTLPKPRPNAGRWLQDIRRLNVAFTRARRSLVLVGNLQTLTALRGNPEGERLLAHLGRCVADQPDHQIEQLLDL